MARNLAIRWIPAFMLAIAAAGCSASRAKHGAEQPDGVKSPGDRDGGRNGDRDGGPSVSDPGRGDDGRDPNEQPGGGAGSGGSGQALNPNLPRFPGAGTSNAGDPLPNGMLCDSVDGPDIPIIMPKAECHFDKNDPNRTRVAATLEQVLECAEETNTVHLRLTFHPWFVDNTYGVNSIGWPVRRGHRWTDLTKSDHAELILKNTRGEITLRFKLDYVTEDPSKPSGYGSLGVKGGDGSMLVGDASAIVKWATSIDRNLNERGYGEYIPDSPATDKNFTANPDAPDWDFRVVYEAWVDLAAFGDVGFGGATIEYVHASPAKAQNDTIETEPGECPPCEDNDPDTDCGPPPPPPPPGCIDNDPDTFCGEGGSGGGGGSGGNGGSGGSGTDPCEDNDPDTVCDEPHYCLENPDDPACHVD